MLKIKEYVVMVMIVLQQQKDELAFTSVKCQKQLFLVFLIV